MDWPRLRIHSDDRSDSQVFRRQVGSKPVKVTVKFHRRIDDLLAANLP